MPLRSEVFTEAELATRLALLRDSPESRPLIFMPTLIAKKGSDAGSRKWDRVEYSARATDANFHSDALTSTGLRTITSAYVRKTVPLVSRG